MFQLSTWQIGFLSKDAKKPAWDQAESSSWESAAEQEVVSNRSAKQEFSIIHLVKMGHFVTCRKSLRCSFRCEWKHSILKDPFRAPVCYEFILDWTPKLAGSAVTAGWVPLYGLSTEGVVYCTDCKGPWGKLWFVIKIKLTWYSVFWWFQFSVYSVKVQVVPQNTPIKKHHHHLN